MGTAGDEGLPGGGTPKQRKYKSLLSGTGKKSLLKKKKKQHKKTKNQKKKKKKKTQKKRTNQTKHQNKHHPRNSGRAEKNSKWLASTIVWQKKRGDR